MNLLSFREQTSVRPRSGHIHVPPLRRQLARTPQESVPTKQYYINDTTWYLLLIYRPGPVNITR